MGYLIKYNDKGIYCAKGDFYIDPWRPAKLALITHGHGDHARYGSHEYYAQDGSLEILNYRLGSNLNLKTFPYSEKVKIGEVWVSFHPAGHILGSSQIRIESGSQVNVVSGDYKRAYDESCVPFEPLECDLFVTESTFALPLYHWDPSEKTGAEIYAWWQNNAALNRPSVLFCYSLGKAQRILCLLHKFTSQEVYVHGAMAPMNECYEKQGIKLLKTKTVTHEDKNDYSKELILAPMSALRSPWMRRFKNASTASASGWMAVRGTRRRRGFDKGFVLSDHADWEALIQTVQETKASEVWVTHGSSEVFSRYLKENLNIKSKVLSYHQEDEED